MRVRHEKYERKAIIFDVCFVVAGQLQPKLFPSFENLVSKVRLKFIADK
jgi:hypothetical protein